jgi:hypothetical protein
MFFPESFSSGARGKMLMLAEGEDVQGIDFSLVRGGVIAGKVTDADGRPVIEERLTIVPEGQDNRNPRMSAPVFAGGFQTDDRGVYRIYGTPAGRYKIFVGAADHEYSPGVRFGRIAYRRTFYPDAAEAEDAKVIEVSEGSEATNIDIRAPSKGPRNQRRRQWTSRSKLFFADQHKPDPNNKRRSAKQHFFISATGKERVRVLWSRRRGLRFDCAILFEPGRDTCL